MKPDYWVRAKRALARRDPVIGRIMRAHPKVFLARRGEPFLTLARAIVGQQISVKAAQSVWDRLGPPVRGVTPPAGVGKARTPPRAGRPFHPHNAKNPDPPAPFPARGDPLAP